MATLSCTSYLEKITSPRALKRIVRRGAVLLDTMTPDLIVCRGVSGMGVAYPLSYKTGIPCAVVRKPSHMETRNSDNDVEGPLGTLHTYVIVDDLIASGSTVNAIVNALKERGFREQDCMGILLYQEKHHAPNFRVEKHPINIFYIGDPE